MEELEIKNIWKSYDKKLDQLLVINHQLINEITKTKAKSVLSRVKPHKYLGIILGVIWVLLLDAAFIIGWMSGNLSFTISIGFISLITKIAIGTYIYHLILIWQINRSDSVLEVQSKLASIQTSSIRITKLMILQLPFWTTWYINTDFLNFQNLAYLMINLLITVLFTFGALWLYNNISLSKLDSKWMKFLFSGSEWDSVENAIDIINQVKEYSEDSDIESDT